MSDPLTDAGTNRTDVATVVLAGGFGTRVRHLLPDVPKPMARVAGRPFLEHVVRYVGMFGFRRVILSTGFRAECVAAHFEETPLAGVNVRCAPEPAPLGTAGGFLHAVRMAGATPAAWLVLNGDSLVFADLGRFADEFARGGWDAALIGLRVADATRFGTLERNGGSALVRFAEKRPGAGVINAGVYLLRHALLARFPAGERLAFETDVFPALLAGGARILVHTVEAPFLDIGTPESLAQAEAFILAHQPAAPVAATALPR